MGLREEAEREEASAESEGASLFGGQWIGVDDDNWLSSIASSSNEDDCTCLSSVSSEDFSSSNSSSINNMSLWSSCSGDDGCWMSGGEEGGEMVGEREWEKDVKAEAVAVDVTSASP